MTTILDILEKGTQFLTNKGIEDARLNMELLVAHELGCRRMDLYMRFDEPGSQSLYEVTAVEMGLFGLLAAGGFLAAAAARLARGSARDKSGIILGAFGAVIAVIVGGIFTSVMVRGVAIVLVIVLAAGERAAELGSEGEGADSA